MEFTAEHLKLVFGNQEVQVRYYGIIIVTAMLIAAWMASRLAERTKRDPDHIWGALTWAIFPGIVGARLYFIFISLPASSLAACSPDLVQNATAICKDTAWYFQNFFDLSEGAIAVWSGGLHIFGALIGGLLGMWLYFGPLHNPVALFFHYLFLPVAIIFEGIFWFFRMIFQRIGGREITAFQIPKYESNFPVGGMSMAPWLDIAAVVLPLAQAIGRWANYINQELYGLPTTLPWGIPIDENHRVGIYKSGVEFPWDGDVAKFHPLFLYESLWNLIVFFVLLNIYTRNRNKFKQGDFFLIYLAQYAFVRFFLEFLRIEHAPFIDQLSIWHVVVAGVLLIVYVLAQSKIKAYYLALIYLLQLFFAPILLTSMGVELTPMFVETGINSLHLYAGFIFIVAVIALFIRRQGGVEGEYDKQDAPAPEPSVLAKASTAVEA